MTDREMLELAARAAGYYETKLDEYGRFRVCVYPGSGPGDPSEWELWNPLTDDGDAFRLANKVWLDVRHVNGKVHVGYRNEFWRTETWFPDGDRDAATRLAITRAAAEIGRQMP